MSQYLPEWTFEKAGSIFTRQLGPENRRFKFTKIKRLGGYFRLGDYAMGELRGDTRSWSSMIFPMTLLKAIDIADLRLN